MKKTVAVAMSGGVDSSVVAALLLEQGYNVIGITMRLCDEGRDFCLPHEAKERALAFINDAKIVADGLGIKHYVADFREVFQKNVIDYFLDEYAAGMTPNPCAACNPQIKFGALLEKSRELGAEYLATGHYARILQEQDGSYGLYSGIDAVKDQSYVLYRLKRTDLKHILFPLGEYKKTEIRGIAEQLNLAVAHKSESQEICFVPDDDYKAMLRRYRPSCLRPGEIVDLQGNVLGRHEGVPLYTVGQRKGLGIAASKPLYVVRLDIAKNQVVVGENMDVFAKGLVANGVNWLAYEAVTEPIEVEAKIRYGSRRGKATVFPEENGCVRVMFEQSQRAVTPGQSVVFYRQSRVVGGGIIQCSIAE